MAICIYYYLILLITSYNRQRLKAENETNFEYSTFKPSIDDYKFEPSSTVVEDEISATEPTTSNINTNEIENLKTIKNKKFSYLMSNLLSDLSNKKLQNGYSKKIGLKFFYCHICSLMRLNS
jgi:hypothetical protein